MSKRIKYLFTTTNGLVLMAMAIAGIVTAIWGTLSAPMIAWGVKDITVNILGMELVEVQREGRIIMLYHSIALAVMAILVYFITAVVRMDKQLALMARNLATAGYLVALISGLIFAYFGYNWTFHGLFLLGQASSFIAGVILAVALWPWNKKYYLGPGTQYAHLKSGLDLERLAFWTMTMATIGSAMLGAWAGAYFGNGFEAFLGEDIIRYVDKNYWQKAIIGHLHIMLALIGIAITLVTGRWLDFKGFWHKIAMPAMIIGILWLTGGSWSVVVTEQAHTFIYIGAVFSMSGGLFLVIYGLPKIMKERLQEQGLLGKASFGQKAKALLHNPLKFGFMWQMIFMNFTVSGVGIFMAVKLTDIIRVWPHREERTELVGHWHILATIIATIILFYFADRVGLKGKSRQWFGWSIILGSNLAFASMTIFGLKRLAVTEYMQQPVINITWLLADIGLGLVLIAFAAFMVWRLVDLINPNGSWRAEID